MKHKFKFLLLFVLSVAIAAGAGCKKESNDDPPKPNPTPVKPKPDPEKPEEKPAAQQLYNEALNDIKQSHDYTTAVQKLTQAAEQNADSANLVLAYMYEYGVGVEQDIAKAKEYYAKEVAINQDGFAAEKAASLNSGTSNCKIVLPEGCNLRNNEYVVICEDTVSMANGDGSFNKTSNVVVAKNMDNKLVGISFKPSGSEENNSIDALESALTLMYLSLPYAFELDANTCEAVREELLAFEETHLLAEEIEKQLIENGGFDYNSLSPLIYQGCKAIYAAYDNPTEPQANPSVSKIGEIADGASDKTINLSPELQNDIRTSITTSTYHEETVSWDVSLHIKNMSSLPFLAVPGRGDADGFQEKDFWANFQFVGSNSDVADIGGSIIGFVRNQVNYFKCINELKPEDVSHHKGFGGDIYNLVSVLGGANKLYREKYMSVEADMDIVVESAADVVRYYYPFCGTTDNDVMVDLYYLVYNVAVPVFDIVESFDSFKKVAGLDPQTKEKFEIKSHGDILIDICKSIAKDEKIMTNLNKLVNAFANDDRSVKFSDFEDLLNELFWVVFEGVFNGMQDNYATALKLFGQDDTDVKVIKKGVTQSAKLYGKVYDKGMSWDRALDAAIVVEKVSVDQFVSPIKAALLAADISNKTMGIIVGLVDRIGYDYSTFNIRFVLPKVPLFIKVEPVTTVNEGKSAVITANANKNATISIYANGKLVAQKDGSMSLDFDLSTLSPGIYTISVQAVFENPEAKMSEFDKSEFECTVLPQVPVLSSTIYGDTPCDVGDDLSVSVSSSIETDISVLVNGVEVGSKASTKSYSVALPTNKSGTFKVVIKGKTKYAEAEDITFSYTVNNSPTPSTATTTLPTVSGTNLESTTSHTGGTAPDVKGQNIDQTSSTGTAPDVKGQNLDDSYSGQGTAPDAKGQKL